MDGSCASSSWTLVRPSACSPSRPPPSRVYHSRNISTDEPHVVLNSPDGGGDGVLRVFLPGTGSNPLQYSCLLRAIASIDGPAIGLSYAFLPAADAARNALCASIASRNDIKIATPYFLQPAPFSRDNKNKKKTPRAPRTAAHTHSLDRRALCSRELGRLILEELERIVDGARPRLQPLLHQRDLRRLQHPRLHPRHA